MVVGADFATYRTDLGPAYHSRERWQFRCYMSLLQRHLAGVVPARWSGTRNWDETVEGYLYFSDQRWQGKYGLEPQHCRAARAVGASICSGRCRTAARSWWT